MSKKIFTESDLKILRENKYTYKVTPNTISFTSCHCRRHYAGKPVLPKIKIYKTDRLMLLLPLGTAQEQPDTIDMRRDSHK